MSFTHSMRSTARVWLIVLAPARYRPPLPWLPNCTIEGEYVVVGADADTAHGHLAGAAYVFDANTGAQLRILYPNEEHTSDLFGSSVAISNGKVLIGAYAVDPNGIGTYSGSVYLFDVATGTHWQSSSAVRVAPILESPLHSMVTRRSSALASTEATAPTRALLSCSTR